jgi:hypothetical protein
MILLSALVHLPRNVVAAIAIALIALHNLTDGIAQPTSEGLRLLMTVLHRPGPLFARPGTIVFIGYPLVPWIAIMALGYSLGQVYSWPAERRRAFLLRTGLAMVAVFVALRVANIYGDPRPWSTQKTALFTVLSFINVTKTPPSLLFVLITVGPALLFLRWSDASTPRFLRPALTIGRVPMFYFLAHVLVIHLIATVAAIARYGSCRHRDAVAHTRQVPHDPAAGLAGKSSGRVRDMGAGAAHPLPAVSLVRAVQGDPLVALVELPLSLLRKDHRKHDVGREDAAVVVPTLGDDDRTVLGAHGLCDVFEERFTARAARGSLCHRVRRRVEAAERQDVDLTKQIGRRAIHKLFLELLV